MTIAIIGAGPAGLTAAYRLQQDGHRVEVLEALDVIGGRTYTQHFGPDHHCDTGAGWLATFYTRTLALFDELGYRDLFVRPRQVRGAADLLIDGQIYPWPFRAETVSGSTLLTDEDKARLAAYLNHLAAVQPADLTPDLAYDGRDGANEFAPLGPNVVEYMMRSLFEGPWFTRLNTLSATHVRLWLQAVQDALFFQVKGGMDAPWRKLAAGLPIRTGEKVDTIRIGPQRIDVTSTRGTRAYDSVILAVPAPAAARILAHEPDAAPPWLDQVSYAPQVRVYAARQNADDAHFGVHILPPTDLFSVEFYSGRHGAWGACPADWQWGLLCTYGPTCAKFMGQDRDVVTAELWAQAHAIAPDLFALAEADVVHYHHWEWAVPIMHPGHYRNLAAFTQRPPIVFAGDWMSEACVEGAVRSGEAAAACLIAT